MQNKKKEIQMDDGGSESEDERICEEMNAMDSIFSAN